MQTFLSVEKSRGEKVHREKFAEKKLVDKNEPFEASFLHPLILKFRLSIGYRCTIK